MEIMLSVREIQAKDIDQIATYWLESGDEYMEAMGVDVSKLPSHEQWEQMLMAQINAPLPEKQLYALIWERDGEAVGHCNINAIKYGEEAYMHLHFWRKDHRRKGDGLTLVKMCIPIFFEKFQLKRLYCEPYAANEAPNRLLKKLGFEFVKEHITTPGFICFEQPVKLWMLHK